jgi:hypothetical protein
MADPPRLLERVKLLVREVGPFLVAPAVWTLLFVPITNHKSLSNLAAEPMLIALVMLVGAIVRFTFWKRADLTGAQALILALLVGIGAACVSVFTPVLRE